LSESPVRAKYIFAFDQVGAMVVFPSDTLVMPALVVVLLVSGRGVLAVSALIFLGSSSGDGGRGFGESPVRWCSVLLLLRVLWPLLISWGRSVSRSVNRSVAIPRSKQSPYRSYIACVEDRTETGNRAHDPRFPISDLHSIRASGRFDPEPSTPYVLRRLSSLRREDSFQICGWVAHSTSLRSTLTALASISLLPPLHYPNK
jgi:hypothetical protein